LQEGEDNYLSKEEEINEKENEYENDKEKEDWDPRPLPSKDDGYFQLQYSVVIYESPCYFDESNNAHLPISTSTSETSKLAMIIESVIRYVI
jgi:hypothetical protein